MSSDQSKFEWFYPYQQGRFSSSNKWIASGPWPTNDKAMERREFDKADGNVGTPFQAASQVDAQKEVDKGRTY